MIQLTTNEIQNYVNFISIKGVPPVKLYIVPGYDCIESTDGEVAFATYELEDKTIILPEDINVEEDKYLLFTTIAHEYYHHIENCLGIKPDENEADAFADALLEIWIDYNHFQNRYSKMFKQKRSDKNEGH